jgi:hypothetical protein
MTGLAALFLKHRRRVASLALAAGVLVGLRDVAPQFPQEIALEFALGPEHPKVVALSVAIRRQGDELAGASFTFPDGAPGKVEYRVKLPTGDFQVWCEIRTREGRSQLVERHLRSPTTGVVRIDLEQAADQTASNSAPRIQGTLRDAYARSQQRARGR